MPGARRCHGICWCRGSLTASPPRGVGRVDGVVLAEGGVPSQSSGSISLRRSGWPAKRTPTRSYCSRSCQSAPANNGKNVGIASLGFEPDPPAEGRCPLRAAGDAAPWPPRSALDPSLPTLGPVAGHHGDVQGVAVLLLEHGRQGDVPVDRHEGPVGGQLATLEIELGGFASSRQLRTDVGFEWVHCLTGLREQPRLTQTAESNHRCADSSRSRNALPPRPMDLDRVAAARRWWRRRPPDPPPAGWPGRSSCRSRGAGHRAGRTLRGAAARPSPAGALRPAMTWSALGGQPGMYTSTGTMVSTPGTTE